MTRDVKIRTAIFVMFLAAVIRTAPGMTAMMRSIQADERLESLSVHTKPSYSADLRTAAVAALCLSMGLIVALTALAVQLAASRCLA